MTSKLAIELTSWLSGGLSQAVALGVKSGCHHIFRRVADQSECTADNRLANWLAGKLADWQIDWLTNCQTDKLAIKLPVAKIAIPII